MENKRQKGNNTAFFSIFVNGVIHHLWGFGEYWWGFYKCGGVRLKLMGLGNFGWGSVKLDGVDEKVDGVDLRWGCY